MRLSFDIASGIKEDIKKLRPNADIRLFGSRTDDSKKGGDIDILVLDTERLNFRERLDLKVSFQKRFGERKIDIVSFTFNQNDPFKNIILPQSVAL